MIACWCKFCDRPCGVKFLTSEEYKENCRIRMVQNYPDAKILSSLDYDRYEKASKVE